MAGLSTLQSGPKGSKRNLNCQPKCFGPLGAILGPSGPFWTISNKNWFLSEMVQKCSDGPKWVPKCQKTSRFTITYPFGPLWYVDKPAMFGHFCLFYWCVFWDTLCVLLKVYFSTWCTVSFSSVIRHFKSRYSPSLSWTALYLQNNRAVNTSLVWRRTALIS